MADNVVRRARALATVSALGPGPVVALAAGWFSVSGGFFTTEDLLVAGGVGTFLLLLGVLALARRWNRPNWWISIPLRGAIGVLYLVTPSLSDGYRWEFTLPAAALVAVIATGPVLWARRMVLGSLTDDVAQSRMVILVFSRKTKLVNLEIDVDTIGIFDGTGEESQEHRYSLADVTAVTVWTQGAATRCPVPDVAWTLDLTSGQLVAVTLPGGVLLFDAEEPEKVRRFIEARVALASESTADR